MEPFLSHPSLTFWVIYIALLTCFYFCDKKFEMLRDISMADPKPYSFSRVQLAWWTAIVLAAFISTALIQNHVPTLLDSTLYLIGISGATTAAGKVIDSSDKRNPDISRHQDSKGDNFLLDILSDENGISIHRFQTVVFNFAFGIGFIIHVLRQLNIHDNVVKLLNPMLDITPNNLILLGLSSATYIGLKTTENSTSTQPPVNEFIKDEGKSDSTIPKG